MVVCDGSARFSTMRAPLTNVPDIHELLPITVESSAGDVAKVQGSRARTAHALAGFCCPENWSKLFSALVLML